MGEPVHIVMRGVPIAKGRARIGRLPNGRPMAFTPSHTRKYESALRFRAQERMGSRAPIAGAVLVSVTAVLPIRPSWPKKKQEGARRGDVYPTSRPDGDNYAKAALDALNGIVFADDSQVVDLRVVKQYGDSPRLEILVSEIAAPLFRGVTD